MTLNSILLDTAKTVGKFVFDIIYFPLWWYSRGFLLILIWAKKFLGNRLLASSLTVWVRNIFTPMYGQRDWAGMLISFLTRFLQIIFRSLVMLFWLLITVCIILLWLITPVIIFYQIIFQLNLAVLL